VLTFWLHFYERVWGDLFDGLLVCHNPPLELMPYREYVLSLLDAPGIETAPAGGLIGHGAALELLVDHARVRPGDVLAFFEDDAVVFKRDRLAECLGLIENHVADLVASPRGSATPELIEAEKQRFGDWHAGEDTGPNFWPNLFMARKALLARTDMHFGPRGWNVGETVAGLDWSHARRQQAGDTMVWMSIQLRTLVPPEWIHLVPQHHASPYDLSHHGKGQGLWSPDCEWLHVGSLSSLPLGRDLSGVREYIRGEADRLEWERRLMYVWLASEEAARLEPAFTLADAYRDWVTESARQLSLNVERMRRWMDAYRGRLGIG
jgi:hypothetical protein